MLVREQDFLVLPICRAAQSQDTSTCESVLGCLDQELASCDFPGSHRLSRRGDDFSVQGCMLPKQLVCGVRPQTTSECRPGERGLRAV